MKLFGIIMILAAIQLFVIGSIIQRGNASMIPEFLLADIGNLPMYCRMFGNRLILLCLIATVCAVMSFNAKAFSMTPVIVFGAGIILVLILMGLDHKKYKSKE